MRYKDAKLAFENDLRSEQHFAEAKFGQTYMAPKIEALPPNSRVLEVGSGSGILLCHLAMQRPDISFLGLEPTGEGFNYTHAFHQLANNLPNAELQNCGYENLNDNEGFDLIYLINVFEHLPSWQDFMQRLQGFLKPNGNCLILCPNYSFPYEPHFRLPIIWNKKISRKLMGKKIKRIEQEENSNGLWNSLNFVKYRQVLSFSKDLNFEVSFEKTIIKDMIERLETDSEFLNRQKILKLPVWIAQKTGLINLFATRRIFEMWLPYMYLSFTKSRPKSCIL